MEGKKPPRRSKQQDRKKVVRINFTLGRYEVVRKIARDRGWQLITDENDKAIHACNIHWIDVPDFVNTFKILLPFQKVNHFPGMSNLARKSKLARNFERMKKLFPEEYDFCPKTWILPFDFHDFQQNFNGDGMSQKTFIIKPDHNCQGRGVFLTRNMNQINRSDIMVAQQYVARPLLIEGKKFDLRIYVLVTSCNPLRVYLFKDGLVRMCTADYVTPNAENMEQRFMHLTNYAVNKHSNNFELNKQATDDGNGSKRSLRWFFAWLKESYKEERVDALWDKIGDICLKSILAVQPMLAQEYRSTFAKNIRKTVSSAPSGGRDTSLPLISEPERPVSAQETTSSIPANSSTASSSFSILGMDVLVDEQLKPWLLEVNHLPSFGCDSPLDWNIKERLISQTFDILNVSADDKERYEAEQARHTQMRLYGASSTANNNSRSSSSDNQLPELNPIRPSSSSNRKPETVDSFESDAMAPHITDLDESKRYHELSDDDLREALTQYYTEHNPHRLKDLDRIVTKYGSAQEELNRSLLHKYGRSIQEYAPSAHGLTEPAVSKAHALDTPEEDEKLVDFILMYPPPYESLEDSKYRKILDASSRHVNEQQMRFAAPLEHRKYDDGTGNSSSLPPLKGAQRKAQLDQFGRDCFGFTGTDKAKWLAAMEKKPNVVPGPMQVAAAHRLMMGHSSQKLSIKPPTPPEQMPKARKETVNYGLQYRERLATLKHKPTLSMSQISFGAFD